MANEEVGLSFLIVGPVIGLILMLIGIIKLYSDKENIIKGRKTVLSGFIVTILSLLIGFSFCTGG